MLLYGSPLTLNMPAKQGIRIHWCLFNSFFQQKDICFMIFIVSYKFSLFDSAHGWLQLLMCWLKKIYFHCQCHRSKIRNEEQISDPYASWATW